MATRKERQNYRPANRLLTVCLVAIALILSACGSKTTTTPATTAPPEIRTEIIDHNMSVTESGVPVVKGTVTNVVSYPLSGVEVWVKFYDAAGTLLGTSTDYIVDPLHHGDIWSFVIIYFGPNPENVESYTVEIGGPN